ncbi:hypothetical protein [Streptomyces sp. CA-251247]|uniref:hypothetical protein n=1 Tax=Streptomyces sp. CA-251247 TaxID=3240062 RepID=UPI003D8A5C50
MMSGRGCRALRAAVFAAVCVLLAAFGHILMSGTSVPWWAMSTAFGVTTAAAWALGGRERGLLVVTSATVVAQAGMHACFSLAQAMVYPSPPTDSSLARQWARSLALGTGESTAPASGAVLRGVGDGGPAQQPGMTMLHDGMDVHDHALHGVADGATGTTALSGHDMGDMSPTGMLSAHLLASLLCGLWLAYGERAAFRVLRSLAGWLVAPLRLMLPQPAPVHGTRIRVRRSRRTHAPRRLLLAHAITSRGPPPGIAVL